MSRIPKLRFKEFDEEWEEKKIKDIAQLVGGGTPETNKEEYWNGDIQWFTPSEIKSDLVSKSIRTISEAGLKKSSAKLLPVGAILLTTRATIGDVAIARNECATNQGFQSLIVNESNINLFVFNWIKNNKHELIKRASGSTFLEISKSKIEQIKINLPSKSEQSRIASFLSSVDSKIDQLTRKKQLLEQYKKGVMQKIFSQELRFKVDDGGEFPEWEEKQLGEIGDFKSGIGFPETEQGGDFGVPFLKVSDMNLIDNTFYMKLANHYVTDKQISKLKFKVIKEASIIFAKVGAAIFLERKRIAVNFLIDNNMMAFTPKANLLFMKYIFDTIKLSKYAQVGALPSYNASDLKIIKVKIPFSRDEQHKIANFLSTIDTKIDFIAKQLEEAKNFKKGLLQQMFV